VYPEDRVLVGVINRQRDFERAQVEHWYRVPVGQAPKGIHAEYIAFFFSRAFNELNGAIHFYARRTGVELVRRRDLLPEEASHPRAEALYHKIQFGELRRKDPPIVNSDRRGVAFIYTTWDRFSDARVLAICTAKRTSMWTACSMPWTGPACARSESGPASGRVPAAGRPSFTFRARAGSWSLQPPAVVTARFPWRWAFPQRQFRLASRPF